VRPCRAHKKRRAPRDPLQSTANCARRRQNESSFA
jgi:hypothetical protein